MVSKWFIYLSKHQNLSTSKTFASKLLKLYHRSSVIFGHYCGKGTVIVMVSTGQIILGLK